MKVGEGWSRPSRALFVGCMSVQCVQCEARTLNGFWTAWPQCTSVTCSTYIVVSLPPLCNSKGRDRNAKHFYTSIVVALYGHVLTIIWLRLTSFLYRSLYLRQLVVAWKMRENALMYRCLDIGFRTISRCPVDKLTASNLRIILFWQCRCEYTEVLSCLPVCLYRINNLC